ncbi:phosphatidylglycerol lysyltransferase domain-containing protein [Solitalea koreensis]|uniref:Phosphatidylglycerol lysyltransferase n=1 Tax=Solitalea koreensis TaxID=543615 RepID=A0A521CLJ4_9SPHI|nr:phosphatidylglycerol lysyltransferase domain-containing protein [Solitalea koreensis]SMO60296.1 phosphatidylglycerol lysyltransferase [Solitalea koreensis]
MNRFREKFRNNTFYWKEILGFLFILLAIYFIKHEHGELRDVGVTLHSSNWQYLILGILFTIVYLLLQATMYVYSFKTVGTNVPFFLSLKLFLKRNLISIFLPGGGVTSLAFFTKEIENNNVSHTKINFASYIYGFIGILSVLIVALPVLIYLFLNHKLAGNEIGAFSGLAALLLILGGSTYSFMKKGWLYKLALKYSPELEVMWQETVLEHFSKSNLFNTIFISVLIEFVGIVHLYVAMLAIGVTPNLEAAIVGYIIATLFLIISPFLRGMGAIEISVTFILSRYGYTPAQALSITLLYRLFEFWLPLLAGTLIFLLTKGNVLLRIFPAILIFALGIVNIISVLTPALKDRVHLLKNWLPMDTINASNYLVLIFGLLLIITSTFLLKGLKNAWYFAVVLSVLSLFGHLTKAIDYEEAIIAFSVLVALMLTKEQYYIIGNRKLQNISLQTTLFTFLSVVIYGVIGFYFLDKKHFGIDFSLQQSILSTFDNFILLNAEGITPHTKFAHFFLDSINLLGVAAITLVCYAFLRPFILSTKIDENEYRKAQQLIFKFGDSAVDYFKTYSDKLFFFSLKHEGFVAYRIANGFAIVLEEPVCENNSDIKTSILNEFERFCKTNGLKPAYYRVDELHLGPFQSLGKKSLLIGQEAILDLEAFTLEGKARKSLRNAVNSVLNKGYKTTIYEAPVKDGVLQKLKLVSDEWLETMEREELIFSQGMFDWDELKNQTIITLENSEEKVVAFLNIIPDYVKGEATYDLIRKTNDAPGGNMDVLIIELINYCKSKQYSSLNLGLAPMSGIEKAKDLPEQTIKFAYEKIQQFRQYKGLRDFKEKFDPMWKDKYLVYEHSYDLLQLPRALSKVMKP